MILHVDTNASCLSLPNARSKTSVYYYLSNALEHPKKLWSKIPPENSPLLAKSKNVKKVVESVPELEIAGVFEWCQEEIIVH